MLRSNLRVVRSLHDILICCPSWAKFHTISGCQRHFASRRQLNIPEQQRTPVTKWFNQLLPGFLGRQEVKDEEDDENDSPDARAMRAKIDQLEAEIADLSGSNKPSLIEPLIATLSPEDQAKVRKALAEEEEEEDDLYENDISLMDLPKLEKLGPKLDLGLEQTVYLRKLDKCLRDAADDVSDMSTRSLLWKTYLACKRSLPPFLQWVPGSVFKVLWESQMSAEGPYRASHVCTLARDIIESGKELSQQQTLFYIDSLLREGRLDEAHDQWQIQSLRLGNNELTRSEYRYLGVRIFSAKDNPEKAQEIGLSLLPAEKDMISSILVPVIVAWIKRGDELSLKNAWALYLRLRTELGAQMEVKDFDNIALTLLNCGRADMALAVFKDLMLSDNDTPETSAELYKASLGLVGKLQSQSIDPAQLTRVSLTALIAMPRRFQNKFFYGSWMKHLIGKGEVDAAAAVVELMMERGLKPDAKHMNGIMGAWLRNGSNVERAKAEQIGWAMIAQRLEFVGKRNGHSPDRVVREEKSLIARWPKYIKRLMPLATTETFSLLLLDFERRTRQKHVELLQRYFVEAELTPNTYYITHLMYAELRQGRRQRVWEIFQSMPAYVSPDLETFACLWDCERGHQQRLLSKHPDKFPGPRTILKTMISWYSGLSKTARDTVREECNRPFYDQVIRCMCYGGDLEGTVVALYAMKEMFGLGPEPETARMITVQLAQVATPVKSKPNAMPTRARRKSSVLAESKGNVDKMSQLLDLVIQERADVLRQHGVEVGRLAKSERQDELLIVLATYLQLVMHRIDPNRLGFGERIQSAAQEMGAPDMSEVVKQLAA